MIPMLLLLLVSLLLYAQDNSIAADLWKRHGENSNYPLHEAVLYCDTELVRYIIRLMQLVHQQWGSRTAIANITNK
jgi:hypothetical protein